VPLFSDLLAEHLQEIRALRRRLEELLQKYPSGLWTHALPKLFKDTYKVSSHQRFRYAYGRSQGESVKDKGF
jgi:hypothetical protein